MGVSKAGGWYVVVDQRYLRARRDLMIEYNGARLMLTGPRRADETMYLDCPVVEWSSRAGEAPETATTHDARMMPSDAACVLLTSGSSGQPKAIVNHLPATVERAT